MGRILGNAAAAAVFLGITVVAPLVGLLSRPLAISIGLLAGAATMAATPSGAAARVRAARTIRWRRRFRGRGPRPLYRMRDYDDPTRLGVHRAPGRRFGCGVPGYLARDCDGRARDLLRGAGPRLVVFHGWAATGRRRTAYEAARVTVPDHWVLCPIDRAELLEYLTTAPTDRPVVLWLPRFEQYFDGSGEIAGRLAEILNEEYRDLVIIAIMHTEEYQRLIPSPAWFDPLAVAFRAEIRLLSAGAGILVDRAWSAAERGDQGDGDQGDGDQGDGDQGDQEHQEHPGDREVTREFAGTGRLIGWYLHGVEAGQPGMELVTLAADLHRVTRRDTLTEDDLRAVWIGSDRPAEGFELALAQATAIDPETGSGGIARTRTGELRVDDRIIDFRRRTPLPDNVWAAAIARAAGPSALAIGLSALIMGRAADGITAFTQALRCGPPLAGFLLAWANGQAGRTEQAIATLRAALGDRAQPLDSLDQIAARWAIGRFLGESGDLQPAVEELTAVLAECAPHRPEALAVGQELARWRCELGQIVDGLSDLAEIAADYALLTPPDCLDRFRTVQTIAYWRYKIGDYDPRWIADCRDFVATFHNRNGRAHPAALSCETDLACRLGEADDPAGAAVELGRLTRRSEWLLGRRRPQTLRTRERWAWWSGSAGRVLDAVAGYQELTAECLAVLGATHPTTLLVRRNHAHWLDQAARPAEAAAELEAVLDGEIEILGRRRPQTLRTRFELARLTGIGNPDRAYREFRDLLADQEEVLGAEHPHAVRTRRQCDYFGAVLDKGFTDGEPGPAPGRGLGRIAAVRRWTGGPAANQELTEADPSVYVARQPIYDRTDLVYGYELLFRDSQGAISATKRTVTATSNVIVNAFAEFGAGSLAEYRPCFINVTREFLVGRLAIPVAPEQIVLEVLRTVELDDEVVAGLRALAERGHQLAVDTIGWGPGHFQLLPLVSYVKIDLQHTDLDTARMIAKSCHARDLPLIGQRIETKAQLIRADQLGCRLLQGFALSRPRIVAKQTVPASRLRHLELINLLSTPAGEVNTSRVAAIVQSDVGLSERFLRLCNSAESGLRRKVTSVHEALVILGLDRLREWVFLMHLGELAEGDEAQLASMIDRIRLGQLLARRIGFSEKIAFTAGLLAEVAALRGTGIETAVRDYPLDEEVARAIVERSGQLGQILRAVESYASAQSGTTGYRRDPAMPSSGEMAGLYLSAAGYTNLMTEMMSDVTSSRRVAVGPRGRW